MTTPLKRIFRKVKILSNTWLRKESGFDWQGINTREPDSNYSFRHKLEQKFLNFPECLQSQRGIIYIPFKTSGK